MVFKVLRDSIERSVQPCTRASSSKTLLANPDEYIGKVSLSDNVFVVKNDGDTILREEERTEDGAALAIIVRNAVGTVPRLLELGVKPSLISSAINLIIGQRLVNGQILTSPTPDAQGRLTYNLQTASGNLITSPLQTSAILAAARSDVYVMMLSFRYTFQ